MPSILRLVRLALLVSIFALPGCSMFHPRSSSRIVEGESPTIKYTDREAAGGRIGGR